MKDHLDWIEVGRILRQIAQARPDCRNCLFNTSDLVGRKVVDHDNISALERWSETLLEVVKTLDKPYIKVYSLGQL